MYMRKKAILYRFHTVQHVIFKQILFKVLMTESFTTVMMTICIIIP